jgi:hypothetical protein
MPVWIFSRPDRMAAAGEQVTKTGFKGCRARKAI